MYYTIKYQKRRVVLQPAASKAAAQKRAKAYRKKTGRKMKVGHT